MTFKFPIRARTSLLVGVALLIAGCSRPGSTTGSSALKPIDQAALQTMVDTTAKELLIPGAVVLLRTPQGEFAVTYATALLGATSPPRADTHFRIASNTKTMTAAVIVLLAQEGKLSLDNPVSKYVQGVPNGDNITITELLNMRSGLYTYDDDPKFWAILERDPTKVWTPAEVLAIAFKHPPYFPSGTDFHYSNTNYALLGLIAEKIDGKPLANCFQNRLFGPLGLKDTLLPANDLATWIRALVGGKVLNADYQRQWLDSLQPEVPSKPDGQKYGYGISQISWGPNTIYFHGGEMPGFNSKISYDPTNKLTLIIWTNLTVSLDGHQTANTPFREGARSHLRGVTAVALPIADQVYLQGSATLDLLGLTTKPVRALANALRTTHSTFILIL